MSEERRRLSPGQLADCFGKPPKDSGRRRTTIRSWMRTTQGGLSFLRPALEAVSLEHPPTKLSDLVLYSSERTDRIPVLCQGDLAQRNLYGGAGNDRLAWWGDGCPASRMKRIEGHRGSGTAGVVESRALTKWVVRGV
jgi:hypothetical protein